MDDTLVKIIISAISAFIASSGFWTFIIKKDTRRSATTQMLLGLAHDRLLFLSMKYIERGWLGKEEYENLYEYLYLPYLDLGGNGIVKKLMLQIDTLPIKRSLAEKLDDGRNT